MRTILISGASRGIGLNIAHKELKDTLLLIAKQYIYAQKCLTGKLNISEFIKKIMYYKNLENIVAQRNGKMIKHKIKWSAFDQANL